MTIEVFDIIALVGLVWVISDFTLWFRRERERKMQLIKLIKRYKKGSGVDDPDIK